MDGKHRRGNDSHEWRYGIRESSVLRAERLLMRKSERQRGPLGARRSCLNRYTGTGHAVCG